MDCIPIIEEQLRPCVMPQDLESAYKQMSQDLQREDDALEWAELTIRDTVSEPSITQLSTVFSY